MGEVKTVMEKYLKRADIDVYICLDEKEVAEGIEAKMVNSLNEFTDEMLVNQIGITKRQANIVKSNMPIKRFWKLSKVKGIGEKTYEKLFRYFYKKLSVEDFRNKKDNKIEIQVGEQLSLF